MKKYMLRSNTKFFMIALVCLFVLTMLILPIKEENQLKLNGKESIVLHVNDVYIEEGVSYKGVDVTDQVVIQDVIDTRRAGRYHVYYTYQTEHGKTMTAYREITVEE